MSELVIENQIGVTKATELESDVLNNFKGETAEVGLYLAMARQADREGFPEVSRSLKDIAWDEANHAAQFAELNGLISKSTKENLEKMLAGETMANKEKKASATKSKEIGIDPAHDFFDESSRDEGRHARALEGLLRRYWK